jgi:predicted RNA-binding Zn ribbon-like protein
MALDRPLVGEPLSLDLLNTTWMDRGSIRDLLEDLDGTRAWLAEAGLDGQLTESSRLALTAAREAIRCHVDTPDREDVRAALNEVLSWGHTRPVVGRDGPGSISTVDDPNRRAGWLAAVNYVELLAGDSSRIRRCAHPECVLYFYDTSPKRSRRWCSMAGCGNRAKAARHYARARQAGS